MKVKKNLECSEVLFRVLDLVDLCFGFLEVSGYFSWALCRMISTSAPVSRVDSLVDTIILALTLAFRVRICRWKRKRRVWAMGMIKTQTLSERDLLDQQLYAHNPLDMNGTRISRRRMLEYTPKREGRWLHKADSRGDSI